MTILERDEDERQSHMAGVCLGPDAVAWLARHDRRPEAFSHKSTRVQLLQRDGSLTIFANARRQITSWDTWYLRLRSLFDGYRSSYYPSPPPMSDATTTATTTNDGRALYQSCREVLDVQRVRQQQQQQQQYKQEGYVDGDSDGDGMVVTIRDRHTSIISQATADLVIGADGPDSVLRAQYLPQSHRQYAGYLAWRGTVPAHRVSAATQHLFRRSVTVHMMRAAQSHCIVYTIPGAHGSLADDQKLLNFLWYTNESDPATLDAIMTDRFDSAHRHHNIVPAGHLRDDVWAAQLARAKTGLASGSGSASPPFPAPLLEIVLAIERPFVQVITDCGPPPRAAFEDGRVLLVGDALSLYRPHTAFSGTQAAFDALAVAALLRGELRLDEWEEQVLRYGRLHWAQSIWWGTFYQSSVAVALLAGMRYWAYCALDRFQSWWYGTPSLLRTSSSVAEEYDSDE